MEAPYDKSRTLEPMTLAGGRSFSTDETYRFATTLNDSKALEPRIGLMYQPAPSHTIGFASGLHSQMQPRTFYFAQDSLTGERTNRNLGLSRALHADLYYDWAFARDWHFRIEGYWQELFDIPVKDDPAASFTMLDVGVSSDNNIEPVSGLVNKDTGRNYGLELTLEKFINRYYYLLANATLFSSTFTNGFSDRRMHTAMDGGYILNLTAGGEYPISAKWTLIADLEATAGGGKRYTPALREESLRIGHYVPDPDQINELQVKPYFRTDLRIGFRTTGRRTSQELSIDLQNLTNRRNVFGMDYDSKTGELKEALLNGFGIMPTWRLTFTL